MRNIRTIRTELLEIAFEEGGPEDGPAVLVLHGWPDAPRGWDADTDEIRSGKSAAKGIRCSGTPVVPDKQQTGQAPAHFCPRRRLGLVPVLRLRRTRSIWRTHWYQWFLCVDGGAEKVRDDPAGFARIQWETWSPAGWFDDAEFARTAESFSNPDWVSITLNAYRARWRDGEVRDSRYEDWQRRLQQVELISTPTLMIQGMDDRCDPPNESEGQERYFVGGYRRVLLDGVGHFPHREAPGIVADAIVNHLREKESR
jgi:pimeloyl-ACP methyl ester carboxylesterase